MINYCIYKLPEILNIGFLEAQDLEGGDASSRSTRDTKVKDNAYKFRVELEIDLSHFSKLETNVYSLCAVVILQNHPVGFQTYFTYIRSDKNVWVRISRFEAVVVPAEEVLRIVSPRMMIYTQKPQKTEFSSNMISLMKVRHEILQSLPSTRESGSVDTKLLYRPQDLMALPFFLVEKQSYLRSPDWKGWRQMLCPHGRLMITYYDLYPPKKYKNLLYKGEYANIQNSRTLRPEREQLKADHAGFNKILLGTTLLPKSIAEAMLENVALDLNLGP